MAVDSSADLPAPQHVVVVGAGMVGLATAWFLQEHAVKVTVVDSTGVAAGASFGNAGWLTPGMATPLPEPAVLKYGVRAVVSPSSPVYVPPSLDPRLLRFLARFVRHSTMRGWNRGMRALIPICRMALDSFDLLIAGGVRATMRDDRPLLAAFRSREESQALLDELAHIVAVGRDVEFDVLTGDDAREMEPSLSAAIGTAVMIHGQRFIDPGVFVAALADSVRTRGGIIRAGATVDDVRDNGTAAVTVTLNDGDGAADLACDAVVLATGARIGDLARRFGVRLIVQAGRGYSFSVPFKTAPAGPVYFPAARVTCTPIGDRVRVAGMMEFRPPDAALDPRRIRAIVKAVRPLVRGADLDDRQGEWVGSRPCTADGLPIIGQTRSPRVFTAGGHGMWGITLGPVTGRLLAQQIATGERPGEFSGFDPLR